MFCESPTRVPQEFRCVGLLLFLNGVTLLRTPTGVWPGQCYDNGQGSFGTRVLAGLDAEGHLGRCRQSLYSPRIPIVVTERQRGDWLVRQEAWSGVLHGQTLEPRTPQRVAYLWMTVTNRSRKSCRGTLVVHYPTRRCRTGSNMRAWARNVSSRVSSVGSCWPS